MESVRQSQFRGSLFAGLLVFLSTLLTSISRAAVEYSYNSPTFGEGALHYVAPGSGLTSASFVSASVTYPRAFAANLTDATSDASLQPGCTFELAVFGRGGAMDTCQLAFLRSPGEHECQWEYHRLGF